MDITTLKAIIGRDHYKTHIVMNNHTIIGDEPADSGGTDLGPSPYEFILAGLATCTAATLRMYADRKGWDMAQLDIELSMTIEKTGATQVTTIKRQLQFQGNLDDEQKQRLLDIADKCPVHKLLTNEVVVDTFLI